MTLLFKKSILALFCFSFLIVGCKKQNKPHEDVIQNPFQQTGGNNSLYSGSTINARIGVIVTDQNNNPVSNASVSVGNQTGTTNSEGIFQFVNVSVDKARAFVKVNKSGYFLGSRSFIPSGSSTNYVQIQLLTKTVSGTVNNGSGGTVNVAGGPTVTFDAGDVSYENGSPYTGTVSVYAAYLDPMASNLGRIIPGDFAALNIAGDEVTLETFGMVVVELVGSNGQALNVTSGKTVKISMPVASQQASSAPSTIPLWYFDEVNGNWVEEGEATKQGNEYVGEVKHFSFWNCDAPFPVVDFKCRVVCNGTPVQNVQVKLIMPSNAPRYGTTNGNGIVMGKIPSGVPLTLEIYDICGNITITQTVPATTTDLDLGDINACISSNLTTVTGSVTNCNGAAVVNGMVKIELSPTVKYYYFTNAQGQFTGVFSNCSSASTITTTAFDLNNILQSAAITSAMNSTINLGAISTCNQIDEYINYSIDGTAFVANDLGQNQVYSYVGATPLDSTGIYGSSGMNFLGMSSASVLVLGNNAFELGYVHNYQIQYPSPITVNLTTLNTVSGTYLEGTFSGTFLELNGTSHTISGNFRTKNE